MASCAVCHAAGKALRACSRCKAAFYCSGEHQKAHWREHSRECKSAVTSTPPSAPIISAPARGGTVCAPGCGEDHDPLRLDFCGVCLPAESFKPLSKRSEEQQQPPEGAVLLSDMEAKMYKELKALIKNIVYSKVAISDLSKEHVLVGSFKAMTDLRQFRQTVFPGTPESALAGLPRDIRELLNWEYLHLDLLKIVRSAAAVLEGAALRGELQGRHMDSATRHALAPQVVQEALAREICRAVRALGRAASRVQACGSSTLATDEERAAMDQLDDAFICGLRDPLRRVGEQRQYMTRGWCLLIRRDVQRYLQCELPGVDAGGGDLCSSWLDDGAVAEAYPALQELCEQLRCLPHEINSKTRAVLGLLQPLAETSAGATATRALSVLLSLVPRGCGREERVDARVGDGDSGIRLSCSYYIELDGDGDGASAVTTMICKAAEGGGESFEVGVFDDLLLCHGSAALRYFCSPAERAYCVLQVFVHGCDA